MSFKSSKLLVFGLGVAAAAALSYKFTRYLFGEQRQRADEISPKREDSEREDSRFCLEESCLSTSSEDLEDKGNYPLENFKRPISVNFRGNAYEGLTVDKTKKNVTDVGIQCGAASSEVASTEMQCDREATEQDNQMIILYLRLAHTNIFMLKKHFDEELSKQITGDLKVAFYRSQRLGNYIFLQGTTADVAVGATFCAERYDGEVVTRSSLPNALYIENSVSCMTVAARASVL